MINVFRLVPHNVKKKNKTQHMYIYFITVTTTLITGMQLYHSEDRVTYIKSLPAKPYICPESRYESEKHVQYQEQENGC